MEKIDVKSDIRYVAAMMADVPMFIAREVKTGMYESTRGSVANDMLRFVLTDNISSALKATNKDTMREVIRQYKRDHSINEDFAILRIELTYRIIDDE